MADEESDKHVRISWEDAVAACCVGVGGAAQGQLAGDPTLAPASKNIKKSDWKRLADRVSEFNKGDQDWTYISTGPGEKCLDMRIVLARPFVEHLMHSAILTVAGRDTGATRAILPPTPIRGCC